MGMRIGLFGGTFNPIHWGHIRAAEAVRDQFQLDRVCLIPALLPPHKPLEQLADAADRLEMIRLAVAGRPALESCDMELRRRGPSYTIDTVQRCQQTWAAGTVGYLILGMDAFLEIDAWKSWRRLLSGIALIVVSRPGPGIVEEPAAVATRFVRQRISKQYRFDAVTRAFQRPGHPAIFLAEIPLLDVSATTIRNRVRSAQPIAQLVPLAVADFIKQRGMYR
jgi:nicotinate-nucleotide adenylyltransferase